MRPDPNSSRRPFLHSFSKVLPPRTGRARSCGPLKKPQDRRSRQRRGNLRNNCRGYPTTTLQNPPRQSWPRLEGWSFWSIGRKILKRTAPEIPALCAAEVLFQGSRPDARPSHWCRARRDDGPTQREGESSTACDRKCVVWEKMGEVSVENRGG